MKIFAAVSAALVLAAGPAIADKSRPIDRAVDKAMQRGWPAVAVLVETADGTVQTAAAGFASLELRTPMTRTAAFHMCSISKTFTAVAVLRLVDEGKLSLDEKVTAILDQPVVKRIPSIEDVTIGQLLDHSSGIYPTNNDPTYLQTLIGADAFSGRVWTPEEMVELATRPGNKPAAKPGEGHHYSDTNYILLGMIVERVAREPYKVHVARTILRPLHMDATYFHSDVLEGKRATPASVASGYIKLTQDLTNAVTFNPRFPAPRKGWLNTSTAAESIDAAAGLVTTLPDLRKFAAALFRGKLLSAKSQSFMTAVQGAMAGTAVGKQKTRALEARTTAFGLVLFKSGDGPGGFNTLMAYHVESGTIFLGFTNQFGDFDEVDVMMTDLMGAAVRSATSP
ncbi:MAG TPA: serine hydrolase domain-containing protein [Steroidobacteraceae bacterium]|nr:serine hydrolase domain-containing protein [Steroidobacteraceae bacterium]